MAEGNGEECEVVRDGRRISVARERVEPSHVAAPKARARETRRVVGFVVASVVCLVAFLVGLRLKDHFSAPAPTPPAPFVEVATEADEIAALRQLDAEGASIQAELDKMNAQRATAYQAVYGQVRGRLGLPLRHPVVWNAKAGKLEIAPVTTAAPAKEK